MRHSTGIVGLSATWLVITTATWWCLPDVLTPCRAQNPEREERPNATGHDLGTDTAANERQDQINGSVEARLAKHVKVVFADTPLQDALSSISKQADVEVLIDRVALNDEGIPSNSPVTLELKYSEASARTALELLLEQLALTYVVRDGLVLVTTKLVAEETADSRVYDCRDLIFTAATDRTDVAPVSPKTEAEQLRYKVESLRSLLITTTSGIWESIGWGGGIVMGFDGMLVVRQNQATHREVRDILQMLRIAKAQEAAIHSDSREVHVYWKTENGIQRDTRDTKIKAKLDQHWSPPHGDTLSLDDFLKALSDQIHVDILIDAGALSNEGIPLDEPVDLHWRPESVSVGTVLKLQLEPLGLTYVIRHDLLWITSRFIADKMYEIHVYDCHDLLAIEPPSKNDNATTTATAETRGTHESAESLIAVVRSATRGPWRRSGDDRTGISAFDDFLVIRQNQATHNDIRELLDMLCSKKKRRNARD